MAERFPVRKLFIRDWDFPRAVRGPVDFLAFRRLASKRAGVMVGDLRSDMGRLESPCISSIHSSLLFVKRRNVTSGVAGRLGSLNVTCHSSLFSRPAPKNSDLRLFPNSLWRTAEPSERSSAPACRIVGPTKGKFCDGGRLRVYSVGVLGAMRESSWRASYVRMVPPIGFREKQSAPHPAGVSVSCKSFGYLSGYLNKRRQPVILLQAKIKRIKGNRRLPWKKSITLREDKC